MLIYNSVVEMFKFTVWCQNCLVGVNSVCLCGSPDTSSSACHKDRAKMLWKEGTKERQQIEEKCHPFISTSTCLLQSLCSLVHSIPLPQSVHHTPSPKELKLALTIKWQLVEAVLVPVSDCIFLHKSLCANYPAVLKGLAQKRAGELR